MSRKRALIGSLVMVAITATLIVRSCWMLKHDANTALRSPAAAEARPVPAPEREATLASMSGGQPPARALVPPSVSEVASRTPSVYADAYEPTLRTFRTPTPDLFGFNATLESLALQAELVEGSLRRDPADGIGGKLSFGNTGLTAEFRVREGTYSVIFQTAGHGLIDGTFAKRRFHLATTPTDGRVESALHSVVYELDMREDLKDREVPIGYHWSVAPGVIKLTPWISYYGRSESGDVGWVRKGLLDARRTEARTAPLSGVESWVRLLDSYR